MTIEQKLATSLGRRDEHPNIALAEEIARSGNKAEVEELIDLLSTGSRPIRHDAFKTLYEVGARKPHLIAPYFDVFVEALNSKDNRMIWSSLATLDTLRTTCPDQLMAHLNAILDAADRSTVVAKDKSMHILASLNGHTKFSKIVEPVLLERLRHAAVNQFPMYAEFAAETVSAHSRDALIQIIKARQASISYPAKKSRLEKLLRKL